MAQAQEAAQASKGEGGALGAAGKSARELGAPRPSAGHKRGGVEGGVEGGVDGASMHPSWVAKKKQAAGLCLLSLASLPPLSYIYIYIYM